METGHFQNDVNCQRDTPPITTFDLHDAIQGSHWSSYHGICKIIPCPSSMVRRENVLPGTFYFHFYILYFGVLIVIDFDIHFNKKKLTIKPKLVSTT